MPEVADNRATKGDCSGATIEDCKQRAIENLAYLAKLNKASELKQIPAAAALLHYDAETKHRGGCMNEKQFLASTVSLAISKGIKAGSLEHLRAIFRFLDFFEEGQLTETMWVSSITMFFGGGGTYESEQAVFHHLDKRGFGHLSYEKFQSYVMPLVFMMVPSTDRALRRELLEQISKTIFQKLDVDSDGKLENKETSNMEEVHPFDAFSAMYHNCDAGVIDWMVGLTEAEEAFVREYVWNFCVTYQADGRDPVEPPIDRRYAESDNVAALTDQGDAAMENGSFAEAVAFYEKAKELRETTLVSPTSPKPTPLHGRRSVTRKC